MLNSRDNNAPVLYITNGIYFIYIHIIIFCQGLGISGKTKDHAIASAREIREAPQKRAIFLIWDLKI